MNRMKKSSYHGVHTKFSTTVNVARSTSTGIQNGTVLPAADSVKIAYLGRARTYIARILATRVGR
eukprot:SAG11_NODE_7940_length_1079_cov_1.104082_2_plen_64_part_01